MAANRDWKAGDKVRFMDPDDAGCTGTKQGAIYTVAEDVLDDSYVTLVELRQPIYTSRCQLMPRHNKDPIIAALILLRDSTNSRSEQNLAIRALEELEKMT